MASPRVTSPTERGSLQYFQRARSRWQSSPRKKLSPMPQTALKSPPPPTFGLSGMMPPPSRTTITDEQTLSTKSVAEKHAMALIERKGGPSVAVSATTSDNGGNIIVKGDVAASQPAIATRLFQSEPTEQESNKSSNDANNELYRDRLVAFYEQYNPSKLDTVDETLAKFQGKESQLFEKLHKKYASGIAPPSGEGPCCFLEFEYGETKGRVEVTLFADKTPLAAENFRALCTGEKGMGRSSKPLCFRNCTMHRVVENFVIQGGDFTKGDGTGGESIYPPNSEHGDMWGKFKDELFMQHNRKGLLSMANNGANRNGSQFFITLAALANLNEKHVVFGEVTSGMEIVQEISKLATDKKQRPMERVVIRDCGEIRDGQDVRASETVDESLPSTTPFGFTACKPTSFASVANSKESPFSVPSSTKSGGFGSTNASPFSFSASSPKPFNFGGAGATKPFSFAASSATASQSVPSTGSGFGSPVAKTEVLNDTDDDSSQSSASSDSTAPSEDSSNEEEPSVRHAGFSATGFSGQASSTSGFSFSTDSAEPVKPFSFATPTLKNQIIADEANQPKPFGAGKESASTSGISTTSSSSAFSSGETGPVFGASSKLGRSFASTPAVTKPSASSAYPPLSSKAPAPFGSEKTDACALNESSTQAPVPVFGSGGSVPIFGSSSSSGGGFAALASTSPAQTADKGVSSAASPFGAFSKSTVGTSTMVKPLFGNISSKPTSTVDAEQKPREQSGSSTAPSASVAKEPSAAMSPPPTHSSETPTYPPLSSKASAPFRGGKSGVTVVDKDDDSSHSSTETEVSSTSDAKVDDVPLTSQPRRTVAITKKKTTTNDSKPPANPFAGINFADKVQADPDQLKKLASDTPKARTSTSTDLAFSFSTKDATVLADKSAPFSFPTAKSESTSTDKEEGSQSVDEHGDAQSPTDEPESFGSADDTDKEQRKDDLSSPDADEISAKNDDNDSSEVDTRANSNLDQSSLESRRMLTVSSDVKPKIAAASISKKPSTNPFASINSADKAKGGPNQLQQLATLNSSSSDVASSTEISEVNSQSSTDAVSPSSRDAVVSTKPKDTANVSSRPSGSGPSLFADFAHGKPVDVPKIDRTQQETKTNFVFDGMTAVGQPSVTSKLPTSDNPFKTFSVGKSTTAPASSFSSFGNSAAATATNKDAPSISSKEHNGSKTPSTTFSFGSIASAPVSDKDPPPASDASENKNSTFSFGSSEASTATFAFAQGSNEAPKTPVSSPSRFSGWFSSPKDKKD